MKINFTAKVAALAACLVLAFAGTALAQSTPTGDAYGGVAGQQQGGGNGGGGAVPVTQTTSDGGGSLPFTGLQLSLIALLGAGLLGTGVVMRRTARVRS